MVVYTDLNATVGNVVVDNVVRRNSVPGRYASGEILLGLSNRREFVDKMANQKFNSLCKSIKN